MTLTRTKIENTLEEKSVDITQDLGLALEEEVTNPIKDILLPSIGCSGKLLLVSLNAKLLTFTAETVLGIPKEKKH